MPTLKPNHTNLEATIGMLDVIVSISPNECKSEAAATAGEIPDALSEEDRLHAKRTDIDKLMVEREAVVEVPRDVATNSIFTFTWFAT